MIEKRQPPRNVLLSRLSRDELGSICPELQRAELIPGDRLSGAEAPLKGVWFPEAGFVSVMLCDDRSGETEVAMVGHEGAAGTFGTDSAQSAAFECVVQQRGVAHFVATDRIPVLCERTPALRDALTAAVMQLLDQVALTAHANARGRVLERVARWLLMAHDRIDADVVFVTHDVLSTMLGVRRVGVTNALHVLEGERLVRAYRGRIRVLDRGGLAVAAGGLYPGGASRSCRSDPGGPDLAAPSQTATDRVIGGGTRRRQADGRLQAATLRR